MSQRHFHLSRAQMGKLPDLDRWGFAIEEFPRFVPPRDKFLHTHDIVEMVFVREGEGIHRLPGSQHPLKPGTLAIIHHHQAHGFESLTPSLNLINVYFDFNRLILPVLPSPLGETLPLILPLHPQFGHHLRRILHLQFPQPESIAHLLLLLRDEMASHAPTDGGASSGLAFFLSLCCRQYLRERKHAITRRSRTPASAMERVERLLQHLDIHFSEPVKLPQLASMAGIQPHYLCRLFKAHTGESLFTYLLHRRLEKCLLLLRQSSRKVLDIALESGFNDLPHFNRLFKREMKISPLDYRQQWQER